MKILPLLKNGYISRSPIRIAFYEDGNLSLEVSVSINHANNIIENNLIFETVAKFEVIGLYFPEAYYGEYEILENGNHIHSGFYEILGDDKDNLQQFDPNNNFGLKSYLVFGYDSYLKVLCGNYKINELP